MTLAQAALDSVMIGRWQFGITIYHFILVPLTIGLSLAVAIMQTAWHKTGQEHWLQATRFFGKLLLINFSRHRHRHRAGIPVRHELVRVLRFVGYLRRALAVSPPPRLLLPRVHLPRTVDLRLGALSKGMHLATIWLTAIGTAISAL